MKRKSSEESIPELVINGYNNRLNIFFQLTQIQCIYLIFQKLSIDSGVETLQLIEKLALTEQVKHSINYINH